MCIGSTLDLDTVLAAIDLTVGEILWQDLPHGETPEYIRRHHGAVVSTNDVGRVNNVDLRDGVDVGGEDTIVSATNRTTWTIDVLALDDSFLVASSQGNHAYVVYDRAPPHAYRGTFRVGDAGAVDGVQDTDGLDVVSAPLGPRYPMGLLVVQDGVNLAPGGAEANQNFKLVSWREVLDALDLGSARGDELE